MTPTCEQLDLWSAEALGWKIPKEGATWPWYQKDGKRTHDVFNWKPSGRLDQAWREFIPVLNKHGHEPRVKAYIDLSGDGPETLVSIGVADQDNHVSVTGTAAYALTLAFVMAMKPQGYLDWKVAT